MIAGFGVAIDSALYACKKGKETGMTTVLNASPMQDDTILPEMPYLDILVINETEVKILLGLPKDTEIDDYMAAARCV